MRRLRSGERSWDAVHKKGGLIFLQLIHAGRAGIPEKILQQPKSDQDPLAGRLLAASAIPIKDHRIPAYFAASGEKETYGVPEDSRMTKSGTVSSHCLWRGPKTPFLRLGLMALRFMEPTATYWTLFFANLPTSASPVRTPERPSTHDANSSTMSPKSVCDAVGSDRVGLRISPLNGVHGMIDSNPEALTKHLCKKIEPLSLAYLHYLRGDMVNQQIGDVVAWVRGSYSGVKISNLRYDFEEADQQIREGKVDAVAFGAKFIANPDLVERAQHDWPSTSRDRKRTTQEQQSDTTITRRTTTNTDTSTLIIFVFFILSNKHGLAKMIQTFNNTGVKQSKFKLFKNITGKMQTMTCIICQF
ncbi:hypothetical protein TcBrA4_0060950 [Trypanosoma cruzi]|nr:hypothetical protein TcBrA4_0060950 [Trypanosoma cruzi]